MNKTLIGFLAFMVVGVTGLFSYKLFTVQEKHQAEVKEAKLNHPLRGKDVLITGMCYPHSQEIQRFNYLKFQNAKIEILDADQDNKNVIGMVKDSQVFKLNGVKFDLQGFMIECKFEKSPFNIVKVD